MNKLRASNMNVMDVESWNAMLKNDKNTDKDIEDLFIMMAGEGVQEDAIEALVQRLDNAAKTRYSRIKQARGEAIKDIKESVKKAEEEAEEEAEGDKS
jgi:N-methylhydantoinase B/oxoprolinase/acetone carboxylase alpha subunit